MARGVRRLRELIGRECPLAEVSRALHGFVRSTCAPVVGAMEVTCSDECEHECAAVFQSHFVEQALPPLKSGLRAAFRTRNLGARYEWGSVHIAEHHYATQASATAYKLMIVKINSHVAVCDQDGRLRFGPMQRYATASTACGALHALLAGGQLPALDELRELFCRDGLDRIGVLCNPARVNPDYRALFASVVAAQLQARRVVEDIRRRPPHSPTLFLVVACTTLNQPGPDTELVCGYHVIDRRPGATADKFLGLGDDPAAYRLDRTPRGLVLHACPNARGPSPTV